MRPVFAKTSMMSTDRRGKPQEDTIPLLIAQMGTYQLGFPAQEVQRLTETQDEDVPCCDLRLLVDQNAPDAIQQRFLRVSSQNGRPVNIAVRGKLVIRRITATEIVSVPEFLSGLTERFGWTSIAFDGEEAVLIINLTSFLRAMFAENSNG